MMRFVTVTAIIALVVALASVAFRHPEPQLLGFNEFSYTDSGQSSLLPGTSVTQRVNVQAPNLSRIAFLYSYQGLGGDLAHVTVRSSGALLADTDVVLPATLRPKEPIAWWEANFWDSHARFREVPVKGDPGPQIEVTISLPTSSQPLTLWWTDLTKVDPAFAPGAGSQEDPNKYLAIRTEYGPVQPALLKAPTFLDRLAQTGLPWLPAPAIAVLAMLTLSLTVWVTWLVASSASRENGQRG